ncbi:myosin-6-like [Cynara cardunculus var. scolymus]|uniref:myosin-6-like n=1 Tax=Cynara cardunculus var. scolymus TaxID=59895 RepID=UPI000D62C13A|nr:myosin-6-like [Cynara cardunculus var. scolymus]
MEAPSKVVVGSQVWLEDPEVAWIDADVLEINDPNIKVKCSNGKELVINASNVYPKDPEFPKNGVDDMTKLAYLHEPGVLQNLKSRYDNDEIYTYTGNILIAVNPFKRIPQLYEKDIMAKYKGAALGELSPHPYAIAHAAYRQMVNEEISQSILVSGESGAGKTESTKNLMQYLAFMGGRPSSEGRRSVEQQVLESNPVLEAFGNAKTVRNNNSSRFGKFVEIQFNERGRISGAAIRTYLLERSRVCQVSDPERNYHCFYMLCSAPPEESEKYKVGDPKTFHYLNQSNFFKLNGVDESQEYLATKKAMDVVGISSDEQDGIFRVVAAILHLGNIEFAKGSEPDSSQPKDDQSRFHLTTAAELFMCDKTALEDSFCTRVIVTRGESIKKCLDPTAAAISRDAFAKIVYSKLFDWLVNKINNSIGQDSDSKFFIGVLDIYGFESFKTNSFEQFCINLTNEKLQQHFNQHVFKMEQEEYTREEINWSYIKFEDNQDILDLIEKKPGGILALLDEACMFPRSTHETFAEKLYQTFKDHKRFNKPKLAKTDFTICHYAGDVTYQSEFFLDKNKDYVVAEHQALLNASKCSFVAHLFPPMPEESSKSSKFSSIGSMFKQQLQALLETLSHTEPHYVRCVKPNNLLKPDIFENQNILQQLRCGGVMEAIRISTAGFPTRKEFREFVERFKVLAPDAVKKCNDDVSCSKMLLEKAKLEGYQIGKTKVFLRAGQMAELDAYRTQVLGRSATKVQTKYRSHSTHKKYILLQNSALPLQTICRGQVARNRFEQRRKEAASLTIQKSARMFLRVKAYRSLCSSAIRIQASIRGLAATNMYLHKRKTEAAIILQAQCRQDLVRLPYLRTIKAALITQSVYRGLYAQGELKKRRMAAKDTGVLKDAKSKLEQQVKELTCQLEQERQARVDMEEAKNQEIAKLQLFLKEITEYPIKEEGSAQIEIGQLPAPEEIPITGNEAIDKLTAENVKLKYMASALQKKFDEAHKLCEERSQQARDAESMVIELKTSMQSLQEKLCDIETEDLILRQQVMMQPSSASSMMTKDQENGQQEPQSAGQVKRYNSSSRGSMNEKQNEHVEALLAAVRQELGFSQGQPVATYIIYKSLLHWKCFEAEKTNVFDRVIQMIGSAIEKEHDNKHLAYWLSTTSTLLFLLHRSLCPAQKSSQTPSLFGRMTQGFKSSSFSDVVRHVEAKYPALLFKQQLTAYVEKIYAIIRDNLKKDLAPLLSSCIEAPRTPKDNPPPSSHWESIIECLNGMLNICKEYHVPAVLVQKIFIEAFSYINVQLFNSLLIHQECCTFRNGEYVKSGLVELEQWCDQTTREYVGSSLDELQHTSQAVGFLVIPQKSKIGYDELTTKLCPVLSVQQHHRLCTLYSDDNNSGSVTPEVISNLKVLMKSAADTESKAYLLKDNSSTPFSTEEINHCLHEKDFADVKPSGELLENPAFQFLLE